MLISNGRRTRPKFSREFRSRLICGAAWIALPVWACGSALGQVTPPVIPPGVFNVTVSNPLIAGGATAVTTPGTDNSGVINSFINYAANNGGGTVEVPAGTYGSNTLFMNSNVNLQLDSGATLQNLTPSNTFVEGFGLSNFAISGSGTLDDDTTVRSPNTAMVLLEGDEQFAVNGVSIDNASLVHMVAQFDEDVTINGVTIADPLGTKANGDGIDFSGANFLIENCNISDGDDDIVAKPADQFCTNITIANCTIGAGHGISIGGQTTAGLTNMTVTNCTFNGTTDGLRLKAGRGNGGLVQNVTYSNITMTNVPNPIYITSWYNNGSDTQPSDATGAASAPFTAGQTPQWNNITFNNITSNDATTGNSGIIYGLPEAPITNVTFNNVSLSSKSFMLANFAGFNGVFDPNAPADPNSEILFENSSINGTALTQNSLTVHSLFQDSPHGQVETVIVIPEPASASLITAGIALVAQRRRSRNRFGGRARTIGENIMS
jgi:polygalacturonase